LAGAAQDAFVSNSEMDAVGPRDARRLSATLQAMAMPEVRIQKRCCGQNPFVKWMQIVWLRIGQSGGHYK
jgi:hypothetical protein